MNRWSHNVNGIDIFSEDWDNFVILDACRYDIFRNQSELPGHLESRTSKGSSTVEFLKANFDGRDLRDTVYVTANPQLYWKRDIIETELHTVEHIWQQEGWDEEYQTVLPETVTEYATRIAEQYPNKRLIVHYIQPHYPFIGSETDFDKGHLNDPTTNEGNVWSQLMSGDLDPAEAGVWDAYTENLSLALPHVEDLMKSLGGKTIVTADHGNVAGERAFPFPIKEWGHPHGIYLEELVKVPWLIYENGARRKITRESNDAQQTDVNTEVVQDRLRQLGYHE